MIKKLILFVFCSVLLSGSVRGESSEVQKLRVAAEQGDAHAQNNLGSIYADGKGVAQDSAEAVKWFQLSADQGLVEAQFKLGVLYENGKGVP